MLNSEKDSNRVLVVGQQELDRDIYLDQFEHWGMDACATSCYVEALKVVQMSCEIGKPVDLVVFDQDAANVGLETFINSVRSTHSGDDLPILAIGPNSFIKYELDAFDDLIQIKLTKPCAPSRLEKIVAELLEKSAPSERSLKVMTDMPEFGVDVLIAEDNEVNQIVFTQILLDLGVEFKIANNGKEAVKYWQELSPALVLIDVSMPVMNGHEATREIRRLEEGKAYRTPICAITAHALRGDKEDCIAAGMDDYISKPVSPDVMTEKVKSLLPISHPLSSKQIGSILTNKAA